MSQECTSRTFYPPGTPLKYKFSISNSSCPCRQASSPPASFVFIAPLTMGVAGLSAAHLQMLAAAIPPPPPGDPPMPPPPPPPAAPMPPPPPPPFVPPPRPRLTVRDRRQWCVINRLGGAIFEARRDDIFSADFKRRTLRALIEI